MKYLWSFVLLMLCVDWLDSSSPSKDPGTRRRKNRPRIESTTTIQTLHDLLNGSTSPDTVPSSQSNSQGQPDVSRNEKTEPHPSEMATPVFEETIDVIQFRNISAVEDDDALVTSAEQNHGKSTTKSVGQKQSTTTDIKDVARRSTTLALSSTSMLSTATPSTLSSSSSPDAIIRPTSEAADAANTSIPSTTPTIFTFADSSRENVTGVLTVLKQRCPPELDDCASSTSASSSGQTAVRGDVADAAPNFHSASSSTSSPGLTQQPRSLSRRAGAAVLARTACGPCDVRLCQPVFPESCQGQIRKDSCSCCPICSSYDDAGTEMLTVSAGASGVGGGGISGSANVCDTIRCPRGRVCLLNIQGLPMCRCPSVFQCRRLPDRPVCSTDGKTFKNPCFLSVEECVSARTLSVAHDGTCNADVLMTLAIARLQQSTSVPPVTSALRLHMQQPQILMSDERVRHQGNRVRNRADLNRQRLLHRRQKQARKHEQKPAPDVAPTDKRRPSAQAKRKSQRQGESY